MTKASPATSFWLGLLATIISSWNLFSFIEKYWLSTSYSTMINDDSITKLIFGIEGGFSMLAVIGLLFNSVPDYIGAFLGTLLSGNLMALVYQNEIYGLLSEIGLA